MHSLLRSGVRRCAHRQAFRILTLTLILLPASPALVRGEPATHEKESVAYFEKKIRPLLVDKCSNCHSASTNARGGLRIDDRNGLIQGGNRGPAVVPGHPEKSLLIQAVRYADDLKMPPRKQLDEEQLAILTKWIQDGAAWPSEKVPVALGKHNEKYDKLRKEHWAWQPLRDAKVPPLRDETWPRSPVDRFILARLE